MWEGDGGMLGRVPLNEGLGKVFPKVRARLGPSVRAHLCWVAVRECRDAGHGPKWVLGLKFSVLIEWAATDLTHSLNDILY